MGQRSDGQSNPPFPARALDAQAATNTLLRELRDRARGLPGGLDEIAAGEAIVDELQRAVTPDSVALYAVDQEGSSRLLASTENAHAQPFAKSRAGENSELGPLAATDDPRHAIYELRVDQDLIGVLACWRRASGWTPAELVTIETIANQAAAQLDSVQLFQEVRALATVEERHRLAREIHDGIAQEIASLGYVVDELIASTETSAARVQLGNLRDELSRLVTELRLSIFDLRSDIDSDVGLVAALSRYVRQIGATSDLRIHLVLAESTQRLPRSTEFEMLRIAQEAITNVRRHAGASNLWVSCRIEPPHAYLRVADDGIGTQSAKSAHSHGQDIMAERAQQAGVSLVIRERKGGGTIVEIKTQSGATGQTDDSVKD